MLSEADPATEAGRITGEVFFIFCALAGAWKCWRISRRPTTNTKCTLALMFVLLAMFFSGCGAAMRKGFVPSPGLAVALAVMGLAMAGLIIAAAVLALLGLVEFSQRQGAYTQGRAQAIWALALAAVMCVAIAAGIIKAMQRSYGFGTAMGRSQPGKVFTFDDVNFRFRAPDRPWLSYDASKINKDSKLSFMRRYPDAYFLIIAENIGTRMNVSTEQLAEVGKANLQAAASSCHVVSETALRVKGLNGLLVETEAQVGSLQLHYRNWYCATNGYAYQVAGYSRSEDQKSVAGELEQMFFRFEQVDPNRVAPASGGFAADFHSTGHDYTVRLTNSAWRAFTTLKTTLPEAEFGASQGDSCLVVVPVNLEGEKISLEALVPALLAVMEVSYPNENFTNRKLLKAGKLQAEELDFFRDVRGKTFYYRFKVVEGNGEGYLVTAWTQRRGTDTETVLSDAIARVEFGTPTNSLTLPFIGGPRSGQERKTQGFVFNQAGLYAVKQSDYERALPLFRAAVRANDQEPVYVKNALYAWEQLDRPKEALAFLAAQPPDVLAVPEIRARQAFFEAQTSLDEQAISNYAAVFEAGYRDDSQFTEYVNLLVEQKQFDAALATVQKYLQKGDSVTARLLEAQLYSKKKELPKAISLLKELHEQAPFNTRVTASLAEAFIQAGQYTEALDIGRQMVEDDSNSSFACFLKGRSELGLKWYREAKTSFANGARLAPADKQMREYLDYVSGLLGEGDNSAVRDPIDPVPLPAGLTNTTVEAAPDGYAKSYGAYYTRRIIAAAYVPGKEFKTTEYMAANLVDAAGVSAFSTIQVEFDPLAEQVYVNEVRVTDATGKNISLGDPANYYVLDDRSSTSASQKKILNIPVPGLQPGCRLAVTFTRSMQGRLDEFPFCAHPFSSIVPVRESVYFLAGDGHGLKYRCSPPMEPRKLPEGLCWRVPDPMVASWEPLQPPAFNFLPMLWISDGAAQWQAIATNYLASIGDRLELDPALRSKCLELVHGQDGDDAKMAVLASYVQTNLTYKAIEFGRRARIPNTPAETVRNKYGDCKDHAVLLQQMLVAAGVPARLALVSHRGTIQKDLPSLDQFDHMIVFVPEGGGGKFLDCTSKGADVAHAIPAQLAGQDALILDDRNPQFVTVPGYPENASALSVEQHLRVVDSSDVAVEETLTMEGACAAAMRDYLLPISESSRRTALQTLMGMNDAELTDTKIDSLGSPGQPLRLKSTYLLKRQFRSSKDELRGVLRAGFSRIYLQASPVQDRLSPFEITVPFSFETRTSIDIPAGFRAGQPESLEPKFDPRFATGQERVAIEENRLSLNFSFRQMTGKFKASDYGAYRETMAQAMAMLEREVIFKADGH